MTSVEECTNADTGVGAAIAAGSQAEKGIWALFVQAARIRISINLLSDKYISLPTLENSQCPLNIIKAIHNKIPTSPKRLVIAVIIPALYDLLLW